MTLIFLVGALFTSTKQPNGGDMVYRTCGRMPSCIQVYRLDDWESLSNFVKKAKRRTMTATITMDLVIVHRETHTDTKSSLRTAITRSPGVGNQDQRLRGMQK